MALRLGASARALVEVCSAHPAPTLEFRVLCLVASEAPQKCYTFSSKGDQVSHKVYKVYSLSY